MGTVRKPQHLGGSAGSILSIGSSGSILSIGSTGSILSIGSAGSILSIGSVRLGGVHLLGRVGRIRPLDPVRAVTQVCPGVAVGRP
jgi:hypothetical protein